MKMHKALSFRKALAVATLFASASSFAYTDNKWQADPSGNWNGKWSEVVHWSQGRLPDASTDDNAIFDNQEVPYTVEIDGDHTVPGFFKIGDNVARPGSGVVTFLGAGSVRQIPQTTYVYGEREVRFADGVTLGECTNMQVLAGGKVIVSGNASIIVANKLQFFDGAEVHIQDNGAVHGKLALDAGCASGALTMTGGMLKCPANVAAFPAGFDIEILGGRVTIIGNCLDNRFLPKTQDVVFEHIGSGTGSFKFTEPFTNELVGTYIGTNAAVNSGFRFDAAAEIYGGGSLFADWYLPMSGSAVTSVVDVTHLSIGTTVYPNSGNVTFYPSDMTISAHGNYTYTRSDLSALFAGQVTFDTLDTFNRAMTHTAEFPGVGETPGFGLRVTGGGGQTVIWKEISQRVPAIREISVSPGTSLTFGENSLQQCVRPDRLELGSGSSLAYKASMNTLDAAEAGIAATASVSVDMAGFAADQNKLVRPVFMASAGDAPTLSQFSFSNVSGWEMKNVGGIVYAKSIMAEANPNPSAWRWTGGEDGDWSNRRNWAYNGSTGPGGGAEAYFTIVDSGRNEIEIPVGGAAIKRIVGGGVYDGGWYRNAEPFVFRGGDLTVGSTAAGDYKSGIFSCSQSPLIFDCRVIGTTLGVLGYSFVAFRGGMTADELKMVSEVRIGGSAQIGKITASADNYTGDSRYTTLTILRGGRLATSQGVSNNKHLGIHVLGGGSATFAGTFAYSSSSIPTSYQVDGRLVFSGTLNLNVPVTLSGTGRVDVASSSSYSGNGRITMKGGVTLSPAAWYTVCHATSNDGMMPLAVADAQAATLAPRGDIEYGPAVANTPTTTAAERAFRLGRRATLTVATDDIDNSSTSHDVTFYDPIVAETMATVVKTGSGKLTLASAANSFAGTSGIDVRDGTLTWTEAQSLGALKIAPGTVLALSLSNDGAPVMTVRSDVDLEGVRIVLAESRSNENAAYQTVIRVPVGCSITGTPVVDSHMRTRLVNVDGNIELQVRKENGFRCIVR